MPHPPQHCPTPRELDDLELLVNGVLAPTTGFGEAGSVVTLHLPDDVAEAASAAGEVELVDPEGLPLARVAWPAGTVTPLSAPSHGPFRRLHLSPAEALATHGERTVVLVAEALSEAQVEQLRGLGPVLLLALSGTGTADLSPVALVRATVAAAGLLDDAVVVAVPLADHGHPGADHELGARVAAAYAHDAQVRGLVDDPDGDLPDVVAAVVARDRPAPAEQGLVLFFTGLSGSGKSTLAQALTDLVLEQGERTVTSLDGDVVRRNLSAGLTFSKGDRETNIRRIGWVAAEISRHGGLAVVSPIAPFDETRQQVRTMVGDAGGAFFLVHVATPLEECERRDRKGLYAKARRGEIPEFTGISSPYEEPEDADVRVDTTGRTIDDALSDVLTALRTAGHLDLSTPSGQTSTAGRAATSASDSGGRAATSASEERASRPSETDASSDTTTPLDVLFVCTANICRSPSMELLARHLDPDGVLRISSAGTRGFTDHPIDPELAAALPGDVAPSDVAAFRSRRLTPSMLDRADLVLTAEAEHRTWILGDHPGAFRKVFSLGQLAAALERAPEGLTREELLAHVGEQRGNADPGLDVPDPYRRGPEAARSAVSQIETLVRVVVPTLVRSGRLAR